MPEGPQNAAGKGIRGTVIGCALFIAAVLVMFVVSQTRTVTVSDAELAELGVMVLPELRRLPAVELLDHNGVVFTTADLRGGWNLLFFGFINCPDICPTTMAVLADATRQAVANGADPEQLPRVLLVTVDPERDTAAKLRDYVPWFHPTFRGLTGSHDQIVTLATAVNVAFGKVPGNDPAHPENYQVDHSAHLVVINPDGHFYGYIKAPFQSERLAQALAGLGSRDG